MNSREKQLLLWKRIIMDYHKSNKMNFFTPSSFELFHNRSIDRRLSEECVQALVNYLISEKEAEWEDSSHARLRLIFVSPEVIAGEIYSWISARGLLNTVYTIYELHSGEDSQGSGILSH